MSAVDSRSEVPGQSAAGSSLQLPVELKGMLDKHESHVLIIVSFFMGYINLLLAYIFTIVSPLITIISVSLFSLLLVLLNESINWRNRHAWVRAFAVIMFSNICAAPQMYFAKSKTEMDAKEYLDLSAKISERTYVKPKIEVEGSEGSSGGGQ